MPTNIALRAPLRALLAALTILVSIWPASPSAPQASAAPRTLAAFGAEPAALVAAGPYRSFLPQLSNGAEVVPNEPVDPLYLSYSHVRDSGGTTPVKDGSVAMTFEPGGIVMVYASTPTDALAYRGSYSYANGRLTLRFSHPDFTRTIDVPLDTALETVTLPFQLFSDAAGSSTWRRYDVGVERSISVIARAAIVGEGLTMAQASARVQAYGNAIVALDSAAAGVSAEGRATRRRVRLRKATLIGNGIELRYSNGTVTFTPLFGWGADQPSGKLTVGPLASDPRVHIDPVAPKDGSADPVVKKAVFIAPFNGQRTFTWSGTPDLKAAVTTGLGQSKHWGMQKTILEREGYQVQQLIDADASVISTTQALLQSPGVVIFDTHGGGNGMLTTGTYLGTDELPTSIDRRWNDELAKIRASSYASLADYSFEGTPALVKVYIENDLNPDHNAWFVGLTPAYWRWMRDRGANFDRSLVFISACETNKTATLREAIQARAHFAFDTGVTPSVAGAVGLYLVGSLARQSHSAEESYYNIMRVVNTRQMIYAEDTDLDTHTEWSYGGDDYNLRDHFKGYGFNGGEILAYQDVGWLKTPKQGTVWWLLFSGRWGSAPNADTGVEVLRSCWDTYWSKGQSAGLKSPGCKNREAGEPPTQDEVAYAIYLLRGDMPLSYSGIPIPRWTLNDAQ